MSPVSIPRAVGSAAEEVAGAGGNEDRLRRSLHESPVPMVLIDDERRYVAANRPALLAFRLTLARMQSYRVDDLTPPGKQSRLEGLWQSLIQRGHASGDFELVGPDGGPWPVVFYAVKDVRPGCHVVAFAPEGWSDSDLAEVRDGSEMPDGSSATSALSAREREIVDLLAVGLTGEQIAERLALSPETVRTQVRNAMRRVGAKTRAHLVALAAPDGRSRE